MVLGFRKKQTDSIADPVAAVAPAVTADDKRIDAGGVAQTSSANFDDDAIVEDSVDQLRKFQKLHQWDLNLPIQKLNAVDVALDSDDLEKKVNVEHSLLEENSPYPEVVSAVRNYDEDMPCNTIRAWVIGMILTTLSVGINMLFSLRNPSVSITTYVVQLVAYPIGRGWDMIMPTKQFKTFGYKWSFNPHPFNQKEHTIIVVMANASFAGGVAYATDIILAQEVFYKQFFGWGYQLLLVCTTQMIGFGMAGIVRRFLVWPASMIWPSTLVNCTMFYALHDHKPSDPALTGGWSIGRYRWFLYVFTGSFIWYWFPGWIAQFLSYFCFATWIAPNNVIVNQIFGGVHGLGLIPITFDWTIITGYLQSPLIYPFFAIANMVVGTVIFFLLVPLGVAYTNGFYSEYFPMQDSHSYDNTGALYNVSSVMTPDLQLDEVAYKAYSPLFLSTNFALCYGVSFATISAIVVHTALYNGKEVWERAKLARNQDADIHLKMMRKYVDSPDWWYYVLYVVLWGLSMFTVLFYDTHLTWWSFVVCMAIPVVFLIPVGMIQAITNWQIGLNVITEFMIGYMLPGRPVAMMIFKCYGYIGMSQALYFLQDLKMGHYMKVPPRTMWWAQCIAVLWSSIVQVAVYRWAMGNIPNICDDNQKDQYTCPGATVFYTASVVWGAIGPRKMFGPGQIYGVMQWFWLIGAALPITSYLMARKWPGTWLRYVHWPLMLGGTGWIPPATVYIYLCWGVVGVIFNWFVKRRFRGWWMQYNYITSAGLDTGLFISTILIFFTLILTKTNPPQWWGNVAIYNTLDMTNTAVRKTVPPGEIIGPKSW
jgi:OPT family small oligopeptide transporter